MSKDEATLTFGTVRKKALGVVLIVLVLVASVWVAVARPDFNSLAMFGYPGIFVMMAASSASILAPLPGFATVMAAGSVANPLLIALFAGSGSALGEFTGYLAGYGGKAIIEEKNIRVLKPIERWLRRYGFFALVVFAAIPNPFFDVVGLVAGSLSYPARRFLVAVALGNITKYLMLAYLGKTVSALLIG